MGAGSGTGDVYAGIYGQDDTGCYRLAKSYGAEGICVTKAEKIKAAFESAKKRFFKM